MAIHPVDALATSKKFFIWQLPGNDGGYVMPTCTESRGKCEEAIISVSKLAVVSIREVAV